MRCDLGVKFFFEVNWSRFQFRTGGVVDLSKVNTVVVGVAVTYCDNISFEKVPYVVSIN